MSPQLRVWWVRNAPAEAEFHSVLTVDEAKATINRLTLQDLADPGVHSNAYGLEEYENDEWHEYYDSKDRSIQDLMKDGDDG